MLLLYRLLTEFLVEFSWTTLTSENVYAFEHIQKNNVEWNIFMAIAHEPKDKI